MVITVNSWSRLYFSLKVLKKKTQNQKTLQKLTGDVYEFHSFIMHIMHSLFLKKLFHIEIAQ